MLSVDYLVERIWTFCGKLVHYPRAKSLKAHNSRREKIHQLTISLLLFERFFFCCENSLTHRCFTICIKLRLFWSNWTRQRGESEKYFFFYDIRSYFNLLVASSSERICIKRSNLTNLSLHINGISNSAVYFRLMLVLSVWGCKHNFSTAVFSIKSRKTVWFDFTQSGLSNLTKV